MSVCRRMGRVANCGGGWRRMEAANGADSKSKCHQSRKMFVQRVSQPIGYIGLSKQPQIGVCQRDRTIQS